MILEKLKECFGLFGGLLSAILLFLQALGIHLIHFNEDTIDTFVNALLAALPFIVVVYGVYKNSYIITNKAKEQEEVLKEKATNRKL